MGLSLRHEVRRERPHHLAAAPEPDRPRPNSDETIACSKFQVDKSKFK